MVICYVISESSESSNDIHIVGVCYNNPTSHGLKYLRCQVRSEFRYEKRGFNSLVDLSTLAGYEWTQGHEGSTRWASTGVVTRGTFFFLPHGKRGWKFMKGYPPWERTLYPTNKALLSRWFSIEGCKANRNWAKLFLELSHSVKG